MTHEDFFIQFEEDMKNICINCNKDCPCVKLAEYVVNIGIEDFKRQYYLSLLPEDIRDSLSHYIYLVEII